MALNILSFLKTYFVTTGVKVNDGNVGATTDAPASVSVDESATARSTVSLLKGAKNLLIDAVGHLATLVGAWLESRAKRILGSIGGQIEVATATITRPADTTAYTAKDAVSNSTSAPAALTFTGLARLAGGSGYIVKARLMTSQAACTAAFKLHLFNATPTPINDNAAYTLLYANAASRIGTIEFGACQTEGAGSTAANATLAPGSGNVPLAFKCWS